MSTCYHAQIEKSITEGMPYALDTHCLDYKLSEWFGELAGKVQVPKYARRPLSFILKENMAKIEHAFSYVRRIEYSP